MGVRDNLPSLILPPDSLFLPPQPFFTPTPYELDPPKPSQRAVASWPSRTWSPAERVTAGMLNGWRDQLNDVQAGQPPLLWQMPTILAKKANLDAPSNAGVMADFVQMPANVGVNDKFVIDIEISTMDGAVTMPYVVLAYWEPTQGTVSLLDLRAVITTAAGNMRVTIRRHPIAYYYLYFEVVGGNYTGANAGVAWQNMVQIVNWQTMYFYLSYSGNNHQFAWKWTITHYGT